MYVFQFRKIHVIAIKQTYFKAKDVAHNYNVKVKTMPAEQSTKIVTKYANLLNALWVEFSHYKITKTKCYVDLKLFREYIEQNLVYDFLVRLK